MNIANLKKVCIDYDYGLKRVMGNVALYEEVLSDFAYSGKYELLKDALEKEDIDSAFIYAHSLKGLCANLSIVSLYDAIVPLVEKLRKKDLVGVDELFAYFSSAYKKVVAVLME